MSAQIASAVGSASQACDTVENFSQLDISQRSLFVTRGSAVLASCYSGTTRQAPPDNFSSSCNPPNRGVRALSMRSRVHETFCHRDCAVSMSSIQTDVQSPNGLSRLMLWQQTNHSQCTRNEPLGRCHLPGASPLFQEAEEPRNGKRSPTVSTGQGSRLGCERLTAQIRHGWGRWVNAEWQRSRPEERGLLCCLMERSVITQSPMAQCCPCSHAFVRIEIPGHS